MAEKKYIAKPTEQMTNKDYFENVTRDDTPLSKALLYLEELAKKK